MLLVIDVGNTNIVLGIFKDEKLIFDWRISTDKNKTVDEYGLMLRQMLGSENIDPRDIKDIIISSVVPNINDIFPEIASKYFGLEPIIIGP